MPTETHQRSHSNTGFLHFPSPPAYTNLPPPDRQPLRPFVLNGIEGHNRADAAASSIEASPFTAPDPVPKDKGGPANGNPDEVLYLCLMEQFEDVWSKVHQKAVEFYIASKSLDLCGDLLTDCRDRCIQLGRLDLATNIEPFLQFVNERAPRLVMD